MHPIEPVIEAVIKDLHPIDEVDNPRHPLFLLNKYYRLFTRYAEDMRAHPIISAYKKYQETLRQAQARTHLKRVMTEHQGSYYTFGAKAEPEEEGDDNAHH